MASAVKRKAPSGLQAIYDSIIDQLIKIKPCLDGPDLRRPSMVQDLNKLAALAESFSEQRPKSTKTWPDLADSLDQEGVNLWNMSGLIGKTADDDAGALVAALRLAGFRLVEAGLESKPGIEALLHVLQMASKTGATLSGIKVVLPPLIIRLSLNFATMKPSDIGRNDAAASVLTSAAKVVRLTRDQSGSSLFDPYVLIV